MLRSVEAEEGSADARQDALPFHFYFYIDALCALGTLTPLIPSSFPLSLLQSL